MQIFRSALFAGALMLAPIVANGQDAPEWRHGLSSFGDLKYEEGFTHFDFVNPDAPVGGVMPTMGTSAQNGFDSLNAYILKGVPANGFAGSASEPMLVFDSLMVRAGDEPDAVYGLVAKSARLDPDRRFVEFRLREEAHFADGSPLRARDVVKSFELLSTLGDPVIRLALRDVTKAVALGPLTVRYEFKGEERRDLALRVAQLPIFSADYYDAHEFEKTTLEPPLGSGPYRTAQVEQGRYIVFERRDDYWGWHLPVNQGRFNFQTIRYDYFRDRSIAFEAFKSGDYRLREEFTSKTWSVEYDFPAIRDGRVKKFSIDDANPSGLQAWFINTRRDKFADARVRQALDLAFDFEWTNKTLFYDQYERTDSIFENSSLQALDGPPQGAVADLLKSFGDQVLDEVWQGRFVPPVTDGSGRDRKNLRRAQQLLDQAGLKIENGVRLTKSGGPFTIEFLMFEPGFERIVLPYIKRLERLGIQGKIRQVDIAQFEARRENFDYDLIIARFVMNNTPGTELSPLFSSAAAIMPGSRNLSGINDPVVDALITKIASAQSREALVVAARALDRVVMAGHYFVSHWYKGRHDIAMWDEFARPSIKPLYQRGILETWWHKSATQEGMTPQ